MLSHRRHLTGPIKQLVAAALFAPVVGLFIAVSSASAQDGMTTVVSAPTVISTRSVGGVSIDTDGVLNNVTVADRDTLRAARQQALGKVPGDMNQLAPMRKISLARLEAAVQAAASKGKPLSDEIRYMAGLQRIRYVFVYPEINDVVLAGPGEGWRINEQGTVVGITTGRPVLLFDDLLVALRNAKSSGSTGISCSIDPTPEGITKLNSYISRQKGIGPNPQATIAGFETNLGPQNITVTGVPASTHFARVLVAADYRMKRLAMKFDEPPIRGLPSYLDMATPGSAAMPRWWLAANYEPIAKDPSGLAWEIRGQGVKAMAEEDFFGSTGTRQQNMKASPLVQKWADNLTAKYEELAAKDSIFAELRNCMDLAVVAALIVKEDLPGKAGLKVAALNDAKKLPNESYPAPKQVASKASFVKKGRDYIISTSGGVQIYPWQIAEKQTDSDKLAPVRTIATPQSTAWWWN